MLLAEKLLNLGQQGMWAEESSSTHLSMDFFYSEVDTGAPPVCEAPGSDLRMEPQMNQPTGF